NVSIALTNYDLGFFFSSRRRHTRWPRDWSSDVCSSDLLLNKGPLPVNTIGSIVDLTPGSISIAVDRLFAKGLVTRVESTEDRREIGRASCRERGRARRWRDRYEKKRMIDRGEAALVSSR